MLTTLTKQPSLLHRKRHTPATWVENGVSFFFSETARHVNPGSTTCAWKKEAPRCPASANVVGMPIMLRAARTRRRAQSRSGPRPPTSETGQGHVPIAQVSFHGGNPVPSKRGGGGTYMAARKAPQRSGRVPPARLGSPVVPVTVTSG